MKLLAFEVWLHNGRSTALPGVVKNPMKSKQKNALFTVTYLTFAFAFCGTEPENANCQTTASSPKPGPDVLIFVDGERLIGHLERSTGGSITFKSDMAGEITVEWSKIKELHSAGKFAVVEKGMKLGWREDTSGIPQGTLSEADQKVSVTSSPARAPITVPTANIVDIIDAPTFDKAVEERPNIFEDWKGSATVGIALVEATQHSRNYTSSITLERTIPTESWMNPSNRTILSFTSAYGELSQPGTPLVKTSLYHANGERDEYFGPRVYAFAHAGFDHDYSQGLNLEQTFGGGVGWTVIKEANEELDLRGELDYENQQFLDSAQNQKLLGSVFSEKYNHKFKRSILFVQELAILPAWTNTNAYSANGTISLSMPVFKRISFTTSTTDSFLNNPSPGFKKNSFQFTTGITYALP